MIKILKLGEVSNEEIFSRAVPEVDVAQIVSNIIQDVRTRGDEALLEYTKRFDRAQLSSLEVTKAEIDAATEAVGAEFIALLERAAANIRKFHTHKCTVMEVLDILVYSSNGYKYSTKDKCNHY